MRRLASVFLAALLGAGTATGCSRDSFSRVATPRAGVSLHYAFEAGKIYDGKLRRGSTTQGGARQVESAFECDVTLRVLRVHPDGGTADLRMNFSNVEATVTVTPAPEGVALDDLRLKVAEDLEATSLIFTVAADGRTIERPVLPSGIHTEVTGFLVEVADSLDAAFIAFPPKALTRHTSWRLERSLGDPDEPMALHGHEARTIRFEGLFADRTDRADRSNPGDTRRLAKFHLTIDRRETQRRESGELHQARSEANLQTYFDLDEGFLAASEVELQHFDAAQGATFSQLRLDWRARARLPVSTAPIQDPKDVATATEEATPANDPTAPAADEAASPNDAAPATPPNDAAPTNKPAPATPPR